MNFNEYQEKTALTDLGTSAQDCLKPGWIYYALGIGEETGEGLEKIKKLFRDKHGVIDDEFIELFKKEMGDILWYMARLSEHLGVKLDDIATSNIEKLLGRLERGTLHGDGDNR